MVYYIYSNFAILELNHRNLKRNRIDNGSDFRKILQISLTPTPHLPQTLQQSQISFVRLKGFPQATHKQQERWKSGVAVLKFGK